MHSIQLAHCRSRRSASDGRRKEDIEEWRMTPPKCPSAERLSSLGRQHGCSRVAIPNYRSGNHSRAKTNVSLHNEVRRTSQRRRRRYHDSTGERGGRRLDKEPLRAARTAAMGPATAGRRQEEGCDAQCSAKPQFRGMVCVCVQRVGGEKRGEWGRSGGRGVRRRD